MSKFEDIKERLERGADTSEISYIAYFWVLNQIREVYEV